MAGLLGNLLGSLNLASPVSTPVNIDDPVTIAFSSPGTSTGGNLTAPYSQTTPTANPVTTTAPATGAAATVPTAPLITPASTKYFLLAAVVIGAFLLYKNFKGK